ncbi:hypothetical protein E2C01_027928 [Portunus trituberculatus]|uniref:Uncharacterized protein n=1 Tax=Portunus trituberculatus TaxID=210409 RepID=A0A5B7EMV6_PORTR|nr:hypothetical protein [Portunus trituberculatus]
MKPHAIDRSHSNLGANTCKHVVPPTCYTNVPYWHKDKSSACMLELYKLKMDAGVIVITDQVTCFLQQREWEQ